MAWRDEVDLKPDTKGRWWQSCDIDGPLKLKIVSMHLAALNDRKRKDDTFLSQLEEMKHRILEWKGNGWHVIIMTDLNTPKGDWLATSPQNANIQKERIYRLAVWKKSLNMVSMRSRWNERTPTYFGSNGNVQHLDDAIVPREIIDLVSDYKVVLMNTGSDHLAIQLDLRVPDGTISRTEPPMEDTKTL